MFQEVTVLNQDNTIALSPTTGLEVKRRCTSFDIRGDISFIYVYYDQWEVGLDNSKVNLKKKKYFVYNSQTVNAFDAWKNYEITTQIVGLTLEQLFVDMQINPRLKSLPIDVSDNYNNN